MLWIEKLMRSSKVGIRSSYVILGIKSWSHTTVFKVSMDCKAMALSSPTRSTVVYRKRMVYLNDSGSCLYITSIRYPKNKLYLTLINLLSLLMISSMKYVNIFSMVANTEAYACLEWT